MKTSEMIAMLEKDPTLKFRGKMWGDNDRRYFGVDAVGKIKFFPDDYGGLYVDNEFWEVIKQPESVPVWEAIKALKEGQTVTCKCKDCIEPCVLPRHLDVFCSEGIQEGVWYIGEVS